MPKRTREADNSPDDEDLFQKEIGEVKRIQHNQAPVQSARPGAAGPSLRDEETERVESGETLRFVRPGIQTAMLQKLRRGQFHIEATLDLHGLTAAEANLQLQSFIQQSEARGLRAIRVIHGKGHGSEGQQPVLKSKVNQWLKEFTAVLAFYSASPRGGGTGAVDVLLRT